MKRAVKKIIQSDGVSAVAAGIDAFLDGDPVATVTKSIASQFSSTRDALFVRKVMALIEEIEKVDSVLLGQTIQNLKNDVGEDYFNEALFSAIEKSDSVKRTKMYSRLLVLSATNPDAKFRFWEVLNVLQRLLITDFEKVSNAVSYNDSAIKNKRANLSGFDISPYELRRFNSVGLLTDTLITAESHENLILSQLVLACVN